MKITKRVLVTGVGGPSAISFIKALASEEVDFFAADMDPHAAGLYLVPADRRLIIPAGASASFVDHLLALCSDQRIDVVVPTVDSELLPLAKARSRFEERDVRLLLAGPQTIETCVDKLRLLHLCEHQVPVPRFAMFDQDFDCKGWALPLLLKPRTGSGSRGIKILRTVQQLAEEPRDEPMLVEEFLPGDEYSVDVFATSSGRVLAAVPRLRMKVDSGIAVTSRTVHDPHLEALAKRVAEIIGLTYTANVQFRKDSFGVPKLLEVNARFPGTMSLTVRSGVNMPLMSLREVLGVKVLGPTDFTEVAVVRYLTEQYITPSEIEELSDCATAVPPIRKYA